MTFEDVKKELPEARRKRVLKILSRLKKAYPKAKIALKYGLRLFYIGLRERDIRKVEASFPLILPNPSLGMNIILL